MRRRQHRDSLKRGESPGRALEVADELLTDFALNDCCMRKETDICQASSHWLTPYPPKTETFGAAGVWKVYRGLIPHKMRSTERVFRARKRVSVLLISACFVPVAAFGTDAQTAFTAAFETRAELT